MIIIGKKTKPSQCGCVLGTDLADKSRQKDIKEGRKAVSPARPYEEDDRGKQEDELDGPGDQDVGLQKCRKICGIGCVNRVRARA